MGLKTKKFHQMFAAEHHKMQQKNIILNSLKESFSLIWRNKSLFALLLALQIAFFAAFSIISYNYVPKMVESQKAIEEYMSNLKFDDVSVAANIQQQKSILGEDPLLISRNFNEIVKNFRLYLIYIFLLLVFFISTGWAITNRLVYKMNFRALTKNFLKNLVVSLIYLGLIFLFFFSLLTIPLSGVAAESSRLLAKYVPFFAFSIILAYFMLISISLLHNTGFKNVVQKTLIIGIKKAHYILAVYFLNFFLFAVSIALFYYFIEKNLFILSMSITLMLFNLVFGRIFMVKAVEKLD
ncbi:MAG TPA: hypothetical protein VJB90_03050 [Candidatus Nanoarchaeia archaeon]|nr:hypothetical protein [Candidatus Nanoarchaeia archaeon]